jgi:hypothetical protein
MRAWHLETVPLKNSENAPSNDTPKDTKVTSDFDEPASVVAFSHADLEWTAEITWAFEVECDAFENDVRNSG